MRIKNETQVTLFVFSGLTNNEELASFFFVFFLFFFFFVYMVTIVGNVGMIVLVCVFSTLQTPMYYFMSCLSLVDIVYSSIITPHVLCQLLSSTKSISFLGCAIQMCLFGALARTEEILLSTMSYDRYVAICHPLYYTLIMTKKRCFGLVLCLFCVCFLQAILQTRCVFSLPFCRSNLIDHFFCDLPPLLKLSCSSTFHCVTITGILVGIWGTYTLGTIFLSILKMTSFKGRQKAFSTCSSHIICILSFFIAVFYTYLHPYSGSFKTQDKIASVFFTTVTPMLNPFIYSLRNQEVKQILVQAMKKCCCLE